MRENYIEIKKNYTRLIVEKKLCMWSGTDEVTIMENEHEAPQGVGVLKNTLMHMSIID